MTDLEIISIIKKQSNLIYKHDIDRDIKCRKREYVEQRQLAMWCAKELTKLPLHEIGWQIGNKDHSTAIYAIKTIENYIDTNKVMRRNFTSFYNTCKNYVESEKIMGMPEYKSIMYRMINYMEAIRIHFYNTEYCNILVEKHNDLSYQLQQTKS